MSKGKEDQQQVLPEDFSYRKGQKIEVDATMYQQIKQQLEEALEKEESKFFETKHLFINQKGEKASKKEIKEGEVAKVPDIEDLFNKSEADKTYYTQRGVILLNLILRWDEVHYRNIREGNAVPIQTLIEEEAKSRMKLKEDEPQADMKVVKDKKDEGESPLITTD